MVCMYMYELMTFVGDTTNAAAAVAQAAIQQAQAAKQYQKQVSNITIHTQMLRNYYNTVDLQGKFKRK